jgi:tetratricopeptide (TPR) repeat protein
VHRPPDFSDGIRVAGSEHSLHERSLEKASESSKEVAKQTELRRSSFDVGNPDGTGARPAEAPAERNFAYEQSPKSDAPILKNITTESPRPSGTIRVVSISVLLLAFFVSAAYFFGSPFGSRSRRLLGISPPLVGDTNNEEAHRLYVQGINLSEERGIQNAQKALESLQRAVELDPNYAIAWAGIAHLHRDIATNDTDSYEHYKKSMEAIQRALAVDPNSSDAYSALCSNKNRYEYDVGGAETACKRALELDPNSALAHKIYANFLCSRGRFDEAITHIKTAIQLQPVSFRNQQMYGLTLYYARRYDEAETQFKALLELNPNHQDYIYGWLVTILEANGKESEAFEYLIKMLTLKKLDDQTIERFREAYDRSGWQGVTRERIKSPQAQTIPGPFPVACLYAELADKDKAFEKLEEAYQKRSFWIAVLEVSPQLDPLRDDPRYHDLVRRIAGN